MEKDRKFGDIPDWAKRGPISVSNFDFRSELHGFIKKWGDKWPYLSNNETVSSTADHGAWDQYFRDHLGGFPKTYVMFRDGAIRYMNLPEARPEVFDPSYPGAKVVRFPGN